MLQFKRKKSEINNLNSEEANLATNLIQVNKKIIKKTKKEGNRKRRKDQFSVLKNEPGCIVDIKDLSKNFISSGSVLTKVLEHLNLQIKKGEFIVLYGKSGSGKSTLLNIMSGLDRPTTGHVIVANQNLPYLSNQQLTKFRRNHLSFIFQQYHLLNNITGYENVETGAYLKQEKKKKKKNSDEVDEIRQLFEQFDLIDVIDKFPSQMSGGQQQRISIMRALSKNADIIFADEPTGALDHKTSLIVMECLKEINQKLNKTIIMVSHDPTIAEYASRVITLDKGKIINDTDQ